MALRLLIGGAGAAIVGALAIAAATRRPASHADTESGAGPVVGLPVFPSGRTVATLDGRMIPLVPDDSVVVVLLGTTECPASRMNAPEYNTLAEQLRDTAVALRFIFGSPEIAVRQYSRLLVESLPVVADSSQSYLQMVQVTSVPSLLILDREGILVRWWSPFRAGAQDMDGLLTYIRRVAGRAEHAPRDPGEEGG